MMRPRHTQVHATCVEVFGIGVLLRGPSGSGKSDLALRLIDGGARLVADDRTNLAARGGRVRASAPAEISGLLEVRGMGPMRLSAVDSAVLGLVVDLVPGEHIERVPRARCEDVLGVAIPALDLAPFEISAAPKVRLAVARVAQGIMPVS